MPFCTVGLTCLIAMVGVVSPRDTRLPPRVNLGPEFAKRAITPRTQGKRNTCSLFAITALAEYECSRDDQRTRMQLSEEYLIWAANEATGLLGDQAMFYEAVHGLNTFGICASSLMPYQRTSAADRTPSKRASTNARKLSGRWKVHWIKRWDRNRGLSDDELTSVKTALANEHPVACGLRWPKAFRGAALLDLPPPGGVFDGHSIVFTGYDDDGGRDRGGILFFRNSNGPEWGRNGYGVMSYAYARVYANDALWLKLGAPGSETPVQRFEAESAVILAKEKSKTSTQKMRSWGARMWSDGEQLFCRAKSAGRVELGFRVREAGRYRLRVLATMAPNFGIIRIALDGKILGSDFDLYSGRVSPTGSLELGVQELTSGNHILRFDVVGKNAASKDFLFGLDAVDLLAVK